MCAALPDFVAALGSLSCLPRLVPLRGVDAGEGGKAGAASCALSLLLLLLAVVVARVDRVDARRVPADIAFLFAEMDGTDRTEQRREMVEQKGNRGKGER